jgi:hypothetical protein
MAVLAAAAGAAGWVLARNGQVSFEDAMALGLPPERWVPFTAVAWTHSASYLVGFIGGMMVIAGVWRSRRKESSGQSDLSQDVNAPCVR